VTFPSAWRVLLPLPLPPFNFLPPHGAPAPELGCRVVVPWQSGVRIGLLVGFEPLRAGAGLELREAVAVLDERPFLSAAALAVLERVAVYTCAPAGTVLSNLLPTGLNVPLEHQVRALGVIKDEPVPESWQGAAEVPLRRLELYRRQGLLAERASVLKRKLQRLVPLREGDADLDGAPRANQRRALAHLWQLGAGESAAALARAAGVPETAVRTLVKKGYAGYREVVAPPVPLTPVLPAQAPSPPSLSPPPLPEGPLLSVSGGTRAARVMALLGLLGADLRAGKSVLVLAPEQSYVQQAASLLAASLPVHLLSGDTADTERLRLWERCAEGAPFVLVGSYLALLAPLNLGRVVVLEEGSGAYKLSAGCRIFVPTAARFLAEAAEVPLLLADALPTPETLSGTPTPARLALPSPAPRAHIVDLKAGGWPLSADLVRVLKQVEARGRQAVLLAPRRGFSAALCCTDCEHVIMCPNCDLPLRYHRERYLLRCHQCGHQGRAPDLCPSCGNPALSPTRAAGTQWIAAEVARVVPSVLVKRFDSDKREDLSELLAGAPGVLVATTACLRHPPLPNVSLVGVTLLDAFLSLGDFRAEEEAYRLLLNLTELAPGRRPLTLIQTFASESPLLHAYTGGLGDAFVKEVLARRERFHYPPFAALAKVQLSAREAAKAEQAAVWLAGALRAAGTSDDELLGPSAAPVARIRGQYSYQLFVRTAKEVLAERLAPALNYRGAARLRIDIDPRDVSGFLE
jgi:primosomal protein N' (replication factor Y)